MEISYQKYLQHEILKNALLSTCYVKNELQFIESSNPLFNIR
jgi:hypothetical protein